MTFNELKTAISKFTAEQLEQDVTIFLREADEFYPLVTDYPLVESDDECDVLDPGHMYLVI